MFKRTEASIRAESKKQVSEGTYEAKTETEIKVMDREDLCKALNYKYTKIKLDLARTFHSLGVPLTPGGCRTYFENTISYASAASDYEYSHLSESEILKLLALSTNPNFVIDINRTIEMNRYDWRY